MNSFCFIEDFDSTNFLDKTNTTASWGRSGSAYLAIGKSATSDTITFVTTGDSTINGDNGVWVGDNYAYIVGGGGAGYWTGIVVYNVNNPSVPVNAGYNNALSDGAKICMDGNYGFVSGTNGMYVIDFTNKSAPSQYSFLYHLWGMTGDVRKIGNYAYQATQHGVLINDVTNLLVPVVRGSVSMPNKSSYYLDCNDSGDYIFSGDLSGDFRIINATNKTAPDTVSLINLSANAVYGIKYQGNIAYVGNRAGGLKIVDVTNKSAPQVVSTVAVGDAMRVTMLGNYCLVSSNTDGKIYAVDVSDTLNPKVVGTSPAYTYYQDMFADTLFIYCCPRDNKMRIYQSHYKSSGELRSTKIPDTSGTISAAALTAYDSKPSGTNVTYYLSANGGTNWDTVTSGVICKFTVPGNDLRWKAVLTTNGDSYSPRINKLEVIVADDTTEPVWSASIAGTATLQSNQGLFTVNIVWNAGTDSSPPITYEIEDSATGTWIKISDTTATSISVQDLSNAVMHGFRVRAKDKYGNVTGYSNVYYDNTMPNWDNSLNLTSSFVSDALFNVTLSWNSASDVSGVFYIAEKKEGQSAWTVIDTTTQTSVSYSNLSNSASHSYRVRAKDSFGNSTDYSNTAGDSVVPTWYGIIGLKTKSENNVSLFSAVLSWNSATDASNIRYQVERKEDNGDWAVVESAVDGITKIITGLSNTKTHYFRVKAKDILGNSTEYSNTVNDAEPPYWSGKVKATDVSSKNKTGTWKYAVSLSWDGASDSISETIRYDVQQKDENGNWNDKTTVTVNGAYFEKLNSGVRQYFRVRAKDLTNNVTDWYPVEIGITRAGEKQIGKSGGKLVLDDYDGVSENNTQVEFPDGALRTDYTVTLEKVMENEYEIKLKSGGREELNPVFAKPVTIVLSYDEDYVRSQNWLETEMSVYYFDGVNWIQVGGKVNTTHNVVESKVFHFTKFKIMKSSETKRIVVSPNTFTPNGDNVYDYTVFNFVSAEEIDANTAIDVYDINGKYVKTLKTLGGASVTWDGRDQYGRLCESGIYVYRIIAKGNKIYSGTVVIAK